MRAASAVLQIFSAAGFRKPTDRMALPAATCFALSSQDKRRENPSTFSLPGEYICLEGRWNPKTWRYR